MREIVSDLGRYAIRPAAFCYVAAFVVSWLVYSWTRYAVAGDAGDASVSSIADLAVLWLVAALIQGSVVRYLGREVTALGRPRLVAWLVLTVFVVAATYSLAFALQVLGYLLAKDLIGGWRWHQEAEAAFAATVLFPLWVWQISLLAGAQRLGFKPIWTGVWRNRPLVLVVALAFWLLLLIGQSLLVSAVPVDAGDIAIAIWSIAVLLPGAVGYVLLVLLAWVTFLAISQEASKEAATFN